MKAVQFLDSKDIPVIGPRYVKHPGPYEIGLEGSLDVLFPGILDQNVNLFEFPEPKYGDMNASETFVLANIVHFLQPRVIVEYGTLFGRSTSIIASLSLHNARILTVDLPEDVRTSGFAPYSTDTTFLRQKELPVGHYINESPYKDKVTQVRMDATTDNFRETLDDWLQGDIIDLAVVDASHDYETTLMLFAQAYSRLKHGGVILNDDYGAKDRTHIGVTRCFANLAGECGMKFYWFHAPPPEQYNEQRFGLKKDWRDQSMLIS